METTLLELSVALADALRALALAQRRHDEAQAEETRAWSKLGAAKKAAKEAMAAFEARDRAEYVGF